MKKILISALLLIFFQINVHAEKTNDEFYSQIYFSLTCGFSEIKTEKIITPEKCGYIYIDSDNLTEKINAIPLPFNSTQRPVKYISDNPSLTVDESGTITSDGTEAYANITITSGDISINYPVYATRKITRLSLSQSELNLFADRPQNPVLTASVEPADIALPVIEWFSGDNAIASVDSSGKVIPSGIGTTSIYAQTPDGRITAKCTVYVGLYDVSVRSVFITNAIDKIRSGSEYSLSAYVYPDTVNDKSVKWTSSDSSVISVDESGNIRGIETGTALITAETANGVKDTFEIETVPANENFQYRIISKSVNERIAELMTKPQFIKYSYTLDDMTQYQLTKNPVNYGEDRPAEAQELYDAVNPVSNASGYGKYQFIDLSQSNNISVEVLNRYLQGKGVLEGKGEVFKSAAESYNLSELYLVTHACLESGNGFSQLAQGITVNGTTVYNMFGIGAYDAGAVKYGSEYAYSHSWTSVDAAIYGGAGWISENYINNSVYRQNTLYKMRWNPDKPGEHQYATDIYWAKAQAKTLKTMFDAFPDAELYYEIPLYKDEKEFSLK